MANEKHTKLLAELEHAMRVSMARGVFFHQAVVQRAGINLSDLHCVNILVLDGPLTAGQLAERVGLTKGGAITAALDRLETAGMVVRERDPADRRRILVRHTDHALARIAPLMSGFTRDWEAIITSYTDDELRVLLDYFQRSNAAVHKAITDLQTPQQ